MNNKHDVASALLQSLDFGSSIAEQDTLLETARVETSAFTDLLQDKVDLIPGTKGSGKSALFRIFVDFLPNHLLKERKVVIAHGVQKHGDTVFHAFKDEFEKLTEDDFVSFWCIYFTSLAHEQFIKGELYQPYLKNSSGEIDAFRRACAKASIPEIKAKKSLKEILQWTLETLRTWSPRLKYVLPQDAGEIAIDIFGNPLKPEPQKPEKAIDVPQYVTEIKETLEAVLKKTNLCIWLMVDRLDEVFPRRSSLETRALRGLLRSTRLFTTDAIRIKVFLRDDMLEQVVSTGDGFTALTHLTARQADTLRWSEDQILTMIVKRIFANREMQGYFKVDASRLDSNLEYRNNCFSRFFPDTVHSGPKQSPTLRWMYNHTMDGRGTVTPRDILDLLTRAKQNQQDIFKANPNAESPWLIGPQAMQYGLEELSKRKRDTYLRAEFPHLWPSIEKFQGGKSEYSVESLQRLFGRHWERIISDLISIGLIRRQERGGSETFWIPFLYRKGLDLSQGRA
jgi:hypothetical protein